MLRRLFFFYCLIYIFFPILPVGAQGLVSDFANLRSKTIPVRDSLKIDSSGISNFEIIGIDSKFYEIVGHTAMLYWKAKPSVDSVQILYRVLPIDFAKKYQHKNRAIIDSDYVFSSAQYLQNSRSGKFVDYNQMELNGSYGRGISLGNNQDVVLNSNFNLQANGYLLDSIKVEAAITDNTIPFQPEGNTQNLQEFDQISIRLSKNKHSLQLGDYNLGRPNGYFLNYTKRVQGLYFETEDKIGEKGTNKAGISLSIAKGEFARNIFMGGEGNQGPYRLSGNNGEQLFVVLAATEKVYVDNILQERGENADYVINYNTNEVRFMPRRAINQFSRIQIEFEYQTNNYLNSLISAYDEFQINKKWTLRANIYSNQDAKNQGFQQNLTGEQKRFLSTIGDSVQDALVQNIVADTFAANKILYRIKDTLIGTTTYDSVYEYSTDATQNLYSVSFSYTGLRKGNYQISGNTANGRVYVWVGNSNGDYSAVSLIITPKAQQVITLGSEYQIDSFKKISIEIAGSNRSLNTFSTRDNNQHQGFATKAIYEEQRFMGKKDSLNSSDWTVKTKVQYEHVQSQFRAIAPYRAVEFGRDWNVPLSGSSPDEDWAGMNTALTHRRFGTLDYDISLYNRGALYNGLKNAIGYKYNNRKVNTGFNLSLMDAKDSLLHTQFFRPTAFAEFTLHKILPSTIGASYHAEHNEVKFLRSDSLQSSSFYFDIASVYWHSTTQKKFNFSTTYFQRRDFLPFQNNFDLQTHSDNLALQFGYNDAQNHQLSLTGNYRKLNVDKASVLLTAVEEETILGRLQYDGTWLRKSISLGSLYEWGTGQEQKTNFTFVQVPAGQGAYNWIDYNNDGVQQLNEFVIALYPDQKLFIKIFTPSNDYVKVNNLSINQSINFDPANLFDSKNKTFFANSVKRISNQFAVQLLSKILNSEGISGFDPLRKDFADTAILLRNISLNNTFYFNRSSSKWGLDYNYLNNSTKQLLTYGLATNENIQQLLKTRFAISKSLNSNLIGKLGHRSNFSGVSDGNSFFQRYWSVEPALIWINRSIIRITTSLRHEERKNEAQYGGEFAQIQSANIEARYSQTAAGIVQLRFTFSQIKYNGLATAPVAYTMLDGLKNGNNILWYINWQRRVGKGIELLIEYEGRKAADQKVVNTGRMSLRAVL